ncbi:MAG: methyl-accepting chemotaxis protein [Methylococcaceae bacterium]|nr:MAG: methyl-accepting chemotaxis protein [Methylococcaceae bacterium]
MQIFTRKLKIRCIFFGMALFVIGFSMLAFNRMEALGKNAAGMELNWLPSVIATHALNAAANNYHVAEALHVLSTDANDMAQYETIQAQLLRSIAEWRSKYEPLISSAQERAIYQEFAQKYDEYLAASTVALTYSRKNENELAAQSLKKSIAIFDGANDNLATLVSLNTQGAIDSSSDSDSIYPASQTLIICMDVMVVLIFLTLILLLESWLVKTEGAPRLEHHAKLRLGMWSMAVFIIAFSLLALNRMYVLNNKSLQLANTGLPRVLALNAMSDAIINHRFTEALYVMSKKSAEMDFYDRAQQRLLQTIAEQRTQYERLIATEQERTRYQAFARQWDDYLTADKAVMRYARKNEHDQAAQALLDNGEAFRALTTDLAKIADLSGHSALESIRGSDAMLAHAKTLMIALNAIAFIAAIILMLLMERWLMEPVDPSLDAEQMERAKRSFFNHLTVAAKLRLVFLTFVGLFCLLAWFSLSRMGEVNDKSTEISVNWLPSVMATNAINTITSDMRTAEAIHILSTDPLEMQGRDQAILGMQRQIAHWRAKYEPLIASEEERSLYARFSSKYDEYLAASKTALEHSRKNETDLAANQLKQSGVIFDDMSAELLRLVALNAQGAVKASHHGDVIFAKSRALLLGISACIFAIAICLMVLFDRIISRPLNQVTGVIKKLAAGDLSAQHALHHRHDEIGHIAQAIDAIMHTLKTLTGDTVELINAAQAGLLSMRAEPGRHPGEFGAIVAGINQLIDVLNKPLLEIAEVMQQLAIGNLQGRMLGNYEGDLRIIKTNVNRSLDALVGLLTELGRVNEQMANGDITGSITGNYQGEFLTLKANVNHSVTQMKDLLLMIAADTQQTSVSVTQTVAAADQVAEQSAEQMSELNEMAGAVSESSASVTEVAENAKEGGRMAAGTAELAEQGRTQLAGLLELIEQVAAEYGRIEDITGKITRIADKTHLLSLNAGLEALRAGEHGLGFGFVAQQIGSLAEEASTSARDIGALIASSSRSVTQSVSAAQRTYATIDSIANAAQESGRVARSISAAIVQQSSAIAWISQKVHNIQTSGQANAAAAEEISVTMVALADKVRHTSQQVQKFTLN